MEAATRACSLSTIRRLEVVAIDDRSDRHHRHVSSTPWPPTDPRLRVRTRDLASRGLAGQEPRDGRRGARRLAGDWLLFTDGDVLFAPDSLRRAIVFARRHRLGHVVAMPHLIAPGFFERVFVTTFGLFAHPQVPPVGPEPAGHAGPSSGVGAFNLVRRDAYDAIGGHARLALRSGGRRRSSASSCAAAACPRALATPAASCACAGRRACAASVRRPREERLRRGRMERPRRPHPGHGRPRSSLGRTALRALASPLGPRPRLRAPGLGRSR